MPLEAWPHKRLGLQLHLEAVVIPKGNVDFIHSNLDCSCTFLLAYSKLYAHGSSSTGDNKPKQLNYQLIWHQVDKMKRAQSRFHRQLAQSSSVTGTPNQGEFWKRTLYIPGQFLVLHTRDCCLGPSQGLPPYSGLGLSHLRSCVCVPDPHVLVHLLHPPHGPQPPCTESEDEKVTNLILFLSYSYLLIYIKLQTQFWPMSTSCTDARLNDEYDDKLKGTKVTWSLFHCAAAKR